jgi:hypothetical protein
MFIDHAGRSLSTTLGLLEGAAEAEYYPSGALRALRLVGPNRIETSLGSLEPAWSSGELRRKHAPSLAFYPEGRLKAIRLERQSPVFVPWAGKRIMAERLSFYPDGSLKRLFPLDGRISGFWTEKDERELSAQAELDLPFGRRLLRPSSYCFYPGGELKSLTLWPGERIRVPLPLALWPSGAESSPGLAHSSSGLSSSGSGGVLGRIGFSFYRSGALRSFEPAGPCPLETPIGPIMAYDPLALGITADTGSVFLDEGGNLASLASLSQIDISSLGGEPLESLRPLTRPHPLEDGLIQAFPLLIRFRGSLAEIARTGPGQEASACKAGSWEIEGHLWEVWPYKPPLSLQWLGSKEKASLSPGQEAPNPAYLGQGRPPIGFQA